MERSYLPPTGKLYFAILLFRLHLGLLSKPMHIVVCRHGIFYRKDACLNLLNTIDLIGDLND